jgi:hypothetical protein
VYVPSELPPPVPVTHALLLIHTLVVGVGVGVLVFVGVLVGVIVLDGVIVNVGVSVGVTVSVGVGLASGHASLATVGAGLAPKPFKVHVFSHTCLEAGAAKASVVYST